MSNKCHLAKTMFQIGLICVTTSLREIQREQQYTIIVGIATTCNIVIIQESYGDLKAVRKFSSEI
jgi:hypothetical protein